MRYILEIFLIGSFITILILKIIERRRKQRIKFIHEWKESLLEDREENEDYYEED